MSRRNMANKPKRGLGQAVTRQRRKAAEATREAVEAREAREKQAALEEMRRANTVFAQTEEVAQSKFANSLFKSIVNGQTAVLRAWGMDNGVKCRTHRDSGVAAWTDFTDVHCYWPEKDIPSRLNVVAVADVIGQIKGVMQHEFGHLRYTVAWKEVLDKAKYPKRHEGDEGLMHLCWNMLEDERMETCVVNAVPRINRYFATMLANVILGNTDMRQSWLMLAGREYLPNEVRQSSYDMFTKWADDQGVPGAGDTWWDLVDAYKAADTHQKLMDAVANALDFIQVLGATIPNTIDDHGKQDESGNQPEDSAQPRGTILDMFKKNEPKDSKQKPKKSDKPQPPQQSQAGDKPGGDEGDDDSEGEGHGKGDDADDADGTGDSDSGDGQGDDGDEDGQGGGNRDDHNDSDSHSDEANEANKQDHATSHQDEPGQSNRGEAGAEEQVEMDLSSALSEMRDQFQESIRNDADVIDMQWSATDMADGEGLPEYDGKGCVEMSSDLQSNAATTAAGIKEALNSFLTDSAPAWHSRQEEGIIDPLAYRTKAVGDRDYRRMMMGDTNQGLDVHVSMLCDVSYSMSSGPIQALSEALYATAIACDELGIGRTLTLWSSGQEFYTVHPNGQEPTPVIFPAMGGTDPTKALDDLATHNPENASNHLVIIFTDGAWGHNFPSLQQWGAEGRRIVLVRYGRYDGQVQTDMGADEHIGINDVADLPEQLTNALMDVLASGSL